MLLFRPLLGSPLALRRKPADSLYPHFVWNNLPPGVAGSGDCRDSCGRHVEPQRRAKCAGIHHRDGFLQAVAMPRSAPSMRIFWRGAAGPRWSGASFCSWSDWSRAIGDPCSKPGSPSRPSSMGPSWACFLLGLLTKRVQENSAMVGMVAGLAADALRSSMDAYRLHLVRSDRNRCNIFDRLCSLADSRRESSNDRKARRRRKQRSQARTRHLDRRRNRGRHRHRKRHFSGAQQYD